MATEPGENNGTPKRKLPLFLVLAVGLLLLTAAGLWLRGTSYAPAETITAQTAPAAPAVQPEPAVEPEQAVEPQEPEKTLPQLMEQADSEIAKRDYDAADTSLAAALRLVDDRSEEAVPILLKQAQVQTVTSDRNVAEGTYRAALSVLTRVHGPHSVELLPALKGLIATLDDQNDYEHASKYAERYRAIAQRNPEAVKSADVADENAAKETFAKFLAQAQARADKVEDGCLCNELDQSIEDAGAELGPRSYVVALLWQKKFELTEVSSDTQPSENDLTTVLAMLEAQFGPDDARLKPVLQRLIALKEQATSTEDDGCVDVLIERLDRLNKN